MGAAITAFIGLIVIYVAFVLIKPAVFSGQNIMNLLRSMSKYLLIGIAQSYILITGNIDLSIGSMVGMSAMVAATLMSKGVHPVFAIIVALACVATGFGHRSCGSWPVLKRRIRNGGASGNNAVSCLKNPHGPNLSWS